MYGIPEHCQTLSPAEEQVLLAVWACRPPATRRAYHVWSMRERLDTLFGGDLAAAVRALVSESGCGQSELEQAMKVLEEKHLEAEEYDLYDPYG